MNVLRLGATYEGTMRNRQIYPDERIMDSMIYSITKPEWPVIERHIATLMEQQEPVRAFLPWTFGTQRLQMKLLKLEDTNNYFDLTQRNYKSLRDSFPQTANFKTPDQARVFIAEKTHQAAKGEAFFYSLRERDSERQIGLLHIKSLDWKTRSAELGYFVDAKKRRLGYASEAVEGALKLLVSEKKFNRVFLRILTDNEQSIHLAKKLNFKLEGTFRNSFLSGNGNLTDVLIFSRFE